METTEGLTFVTRSGMVIPEGRTAPLGELLLWVMVTELFDEPDNFPPRKPPPTARARPREISAMVLPLRRGGENSFDARTVGALANALGQGVGGRLWIESPSGGVEGPCLGSGREKLSSDCVSSLGSTMFLYFDWLSCDPQPMRGSQSQSSVECPVTPLPREQVDYKFHGAQDRN